MGQNPFGGPMQNQPNPFMTNAPGMMSSQNNNAFQTFPQQNQQMNMGQFNTA